MKTKQFSILLIIICLSFSTNVFSQREIPLEEDNEQELDDEIVDVKKSNVEVYSIFNDFRIPVRENINASDLRYDGWVTEPGMYTFRCRDRKRIRLTYWRLEKGPKKAIGSEFINITPAIDKCQKEDKDYTENNYRQSK